MIGSQALLHVFSAARWQAVVDEVRSLVGGRYGTPPRAIDPLVKRAIELLDDGLEPEQAPDLEELGRSAEGLATSEEDLLLLALFGEEAEALLRTLRRGQGETSRSPPQGSRSRAPTGSES